MQFPVDLNIFDMMEYLCIDMELLFHYIGCLDYLKIVQILVHMYMLDCYLMYLNNLGMNIVKIPHFGKIDMLSYINRMQDCLLYLM